MPSSSTGTGRTIPRWYLGWPQSILSRSTHIWTLPSDACTPLQGIENSQGRWSTHKIIAAFADFSPLIAMPGTGESTTNFLDGSAATNRSPRFYRVRLGP